MKNIMKEKLTLPIKPKKSQGKPTKKFSDQVKGKMCFAFDFGEYATKIAVAKVTKGKLTVKNLLVVENDERQTKIDSSNIKEWRAKLGRALGQQNISTVGQVAVCTVGSRHYISRPLEVPYATGPDLLGLVAYEMSQSLSLDMDNYYFQYKVLSVSEKNGAKVCNVWAAAVSKSICDCYYELLDSLRLKPLVMDVNINGLERIFAADTQLGEVTRDSVIATVDLGMRGTEVNIFQNGIYVRGANVEVGEGKMVSAAKNALGVQIADIHNGNKLVVKPQNIYDIMRKNDSPNAKAFISVIEEWLTEINAVVKRHNISSPSAQITKLVLYGGSPQQVWLKPYLERYLEVNTVLVQNLDCFNIPPALIQGSNTIPQCLNALGLLLIN